MTRIHTLRIFCHSVALIVEAIGTVFILLDTVRMNAEIHIAGSIGYDRQPPMFYRHWYYNAPVLGFSLLFFGMLVAAFVLWLEHRAHVAALSHAKPLSQSSAVRLAEDTEA